jgi:hypothetical protein
MNDYEFIKYIPTPTESYMGIAELFVCGKFTILFKIVKRKDGTSFFPASTSIKMKDPQGQDAYLHAFEIDSTREKESLNSFIIQNVNKALGHKSESVLQDQGVKNLISADRTGYQYIKSQQNASNAVSNEYSGEFPF